MPMRNVVLTERQETVIDGLVRSGRFQNAGEVFNEGLRLVEDRETDEAAKLAALRAAGDLGLAAIERGEFKSFANASEIAAYFREINEKFAAEGRRK